MLSLALLHRLQILLLYFYYGLGFLTIKHRKNKVDWVIGPNEIAGITHSISRAVPNSKVVHVYQNRFFSSPQSSNQKTPRLWQTPKILARLAHEAKGFVYVGSGGYLISRIDERRSEFKFLQRGDKRIVSVLVGSDIRSIKSMLEESARTGTESIADYIALQNPKMLSEEYDDLIKTRCDVVNEFANLIFSVPRDQKSYLRGDTETIQVFLPNKIFSDSEEKFDDLRVPRILHAPSSPFIKGTPLVRAAIARLRREGFIFEYSEFTDKSNNEVIEELRRSHIVLNQFYAFVPGMFGVEALANKCVLLTRSSKVLEPTLPGDPSRAWISTEPFEIYDKLVTLLQNPESLVIQARRGYDWAIDFAAEKSQGRLFAETIRKLL
jgi:hypothetical protein